MRALAALYVAAMDSKAKGAAANLPLRPMRSDHIVALVMTAAILGETYGGDIPGTRWVLVIGALIQGGALIWRRVLPWAIPFVESLGLSLAALAGTPSDDSTTFGLVALVLAVFAAGRYGLSRREDRTRTLVGWGITLSVAWGISIIQSGLRLADLIFISLFAVAPLAFGRAIAISQSAQREAEVLNEQLVQQGERLREQAVQDEREHIARELHDVIAHSVSLMGLQAGAARRVLSPGNEEVERSLRSVEETGRDTLNELRRMLGVMRPSGPDEVLEPQPGLAALPALVKKHRQAGVSIDFTSGDGLDGLSPGVDLAAYRIIQEALTNSQRHAPEAPVQIEIGAQLATIKLSVVSVGADPESAGSVGGGHGIVGMNERAALYGGTVSAGFIDGRGFVVHAELPAEYLTVEQQAAPAPSVHE
jgi:signal transduction histidine kinase